MSNEQLKGHLDLLLLQMVATGPAHGYAVIASLRARSGGVFDLPEGTVYPALHRLEGAGLLTSQWAAADGRRRRVYRLSETGWAALRAERSRWKLFAWGMRTVLGTPA
jgi:DNA-binding PadR family transcriptional regulator